MENEGLFVFCCVLVATSCFISLLKNVTDTLRLCAALLSLLGLIGFVFGFLLCFI